MTVYVGVGPGLRQGVLQYQWPSITGYVCDDESKATTNAETKTLNE
jgi:hypothetical protein